MKKLTGLVALLGLTLTTVQARADAPDVQVQIRSHAAQAGAWRNLDCGYVYIDIGGTEDAIHQDQGQPVSQNAVWASFYSYDYCSGEFTQGWAYAQDGFDGNLHGATLDVTFDAYAYQYGPNEYGWWEYEDLGVRTVEITAELTGNGETYRGMNSSMNRSGEYFTRYRWIGESRDASVDLTVTVEGDDVAFDASYGSLSNNKSGYTEIYG